MILYLYHNDGTFLGIIKGVQRVNTVDGMIYIHARSMQISLYTHAVHCTDIEMKPVTNWKSMRVLAQQMQSGNSEL